MLRLRLFFALALLATTAQSHASQDVKLESEKWPDGSPRLECEVSATSAGDVQRHGAFRSWHENGQLEAEGKYIEGWRAGAWSFWHANGQLAAEGAFHEGLRNSRWRYWSETGESDSERNGIYKAVIETYPSGARRIGGELKGKHRDGVWTYYATDGTVLASGEYLRNRRTGSWAFYWPADGALRYEGEYLRDEREGPWRFYLPGGALDPQLLSGRYEGDERVGDLESARPVAARALPSPRSHPSLSLEEQAAMSSAVSAHFAADVPGEMPKAWLEEGRQALPALLRVLIGLDLRMQAEVELAFRINYEVLAPMHRGHAFRIVPLVTEDDVQRNQLSVARWLALWESTRDWPTFVESLPEIEVAPLDSPALFRLPYDPFETPVARTVAPSSIAPMSSLDPMERRKLLRKYGGSGTEESLELALQWLLAHQAADGSWSSSGFTLHCAAQGSANFCGGTGRAGYDTGVSALALLALMGDGSGPVNGPHAASVAKGLAWLVQQQDEKSGLIGTKSTNEYIYSHAIATLALCRALRSGGSPELVTVLEKARDEILRRQLESGGWRYNANEDRADSSITVWMVHALVALQECGLVVPPEAVHFGLKWLDKVTSTETGAVGYDTEGGGSARMQNLNDEYGQVCETLTAASVFARIVAGQTLDEAPQMKQQIELVLTRLPEWSPKSVDYYGWYHATYALFHWGGKPWKAWNEAIKSALAAAQVTNKKSHEFGSFAPQSVWGGLGGRVYSTAISALMLEVYLGGEPLLK